MMIVVGSRHYFLQGAVHVFHVLYEGLEVVEVACKEDDSYLVTPVMIGDHYLQEAVHELVRAFFYYVAFELVELATPFAPGLLSLKIFLKAFLSYVGSFLSSLVMNE